MTATPGGPGGAPLIVFDDICVMCSASAEFVIAHDRAGLFRLTTAQSPAGRACYHARGLDAEAMATMIVAVNGTAFTESEAILAILTRLGWPWRAAAIVRAIPRDWRDRGYRWIARHRYRWIGRRDTCWIPDATGRVRVI